MPIDRTKPPPRVGTVWGFWSDTTGPKNGYVGASGGGHTFLHFDGGHPWLDPHEGYIDRFSNPPTSNGLPGIPWTAFDPWTATAGQVIPTPPPPPDAPPIPPVIEVPPEEPCPIGFYRAVLGPDAGKCVPVGAGGGPVVIPPTPSPVTPSIIRLHGGRYTVEGHFDPPTGPPLKLIPVGISDDACWMWALSPNNVELIVKVVASNPGHVAPGVGGITNVAYTVTITDTVTGKAETFTNAQGQMCGELRWDGLPG